MKLSIRNLAASVVVGAAVLAGAAAHAQADDKTVRLVVPFAAGGSADLIARLMGESFSQQLGVNVIVDNRSGAGGGIAASEVAHSAPDGKTFLIGSNGPLVINKAVYPNLSYEPERDFLPVVALAEAPLLLVVRNGLPVKTLAELVAHAKANESKPLTMASASSGNITHLAGEFLSRKLGFMPNHVPYRGSAPAMLAVVGGQVDIMYDALPTAMEQARSGAVRPIAVASAQRLQQLPDTPTFSELGLSAGKITAWFGLVAPAKTPADIIKRYNDAANVALNNPAAREKIAAIGFLPMGGSVKEFESLIRSETEHWVPIARSLGVKAD